jgi:maleylpyruvate isomerase
MPARHDLTTDPTLAQQLLVARRGTAYFSRLLERLSDQDLDHPSLLPGWSRRHVVAHVGYNARAITRLVDWAATGIETPMYASPEVRGEEIEQGATQPARALRHLNTHAAITLDVAWRDCPPEAWLHTVRTAQGRVVPLTETVWMRTREVWLHAIDLGSGADVQEIPRAVLERLLRDITGMWDQRGEGKDLHITVTDGRSFDWGTGETVVSGALSQIIRWASGRERPDAQHSRPPAPRWL